MDVTLLEKFNSAVMVLQPDTPTKVVERVHGILLAKIYNATSNEFLRRITKQSCMKENKAVDVNLGLRDKLKFYAAEKQSNF